jgi:hypothetical protein
MKTDKRAKAKAKSRHDEMGELLVLANIREAVGDSQGKLMQPELVQRIKDIVHGLGTAVVLAGRGMKPGPKLVQEWKGLLPKGETD